MSVTLRVLLVGPLPPPSGGMANQTRQLKRLLEAEGVTVSLVQTNAPYRPAWIAKVQGVRAIIRLLPYMKQLVVEARRADVVHVMANSGWSWHLFAAPAIWIAWLRGKSVVVNYRGGLAAKFLASQGSLVRWSLVRASALIVPSRFLQDIFAQHGMQAAIIPNAVDVSTFRPVSSGPFPEDRGPHIVVARNLERLYGNDIAIRAFAILKQRFPAARLSVAGSGSESDALRSLVSELDIEDAVGFTGRLETAAMASLYQSADIVVNPSRADNTPNSILEALACGVPVVSTNVGGVPYLVEHGRTAWLVQPDAPEEMAHGIEDLLQDHELRRNLISNGLALANSCTWSVVRGQWLELYNNLHGGRGIPHDVTSPMY